MSAAIALGCSGSRGGPAQTPVELAIAPIGAVPGAAVVSNGERSSGGQCTLRLVAARIEKSSAGCYLDEHISRGPGVLRYPCSGDGAAEAEFGGQRYTGKVDRGELELELSTELDWEDNCRWGTEASIRGTLTAAGEPVLLDLSWGYLDRVLQGNGCSGLCTAKTSISVTQQKRSVGHPAPRVDVDDDDDDEDH